MPQIITDFMKLEELDGHTSVMLGSEIVDPSLQSLHEGQEIELIYPENLRAKAHIHFIIEHGKRYYYGILDGAIERLNDEPTLNFDDNIK